MWLPFLKGGSQLLLLLAWAWGREGPYPKPNSVRCEQKNGEKCCAGTKSTTFCPDHPSQRPHIWTKTKAQGEREGVGREGALEGGSDSGTQRPQSWRGGERMKGRRARWGQQGRKPTAHLSVPAQTGSLSCLKAFVSTGLVHERSNTVLPVLCLCLLGRQLSQPTSWTL